MAAPNLYWQSHIFESVAIESVSDLKVVTRDKMKKIGLANATVHQYDVNGSTTDTILAVCYVALGSHKWMAIVMAAGTQAAALKDRLIEEFQNVHWL
jgi:hypothetical protein